MNPLRWTPAVVLSALLVVGCAGSNTKPRSDASVRADSAPAALPSEVRTLASFQSAAARHRSNVSLPTFERTPAQVEASVARVTGDADAALDALAAQPHASATFRSTFAAIDDILYPVVNTANRVALMAQTNTDPGMRETCFASLSTLSDWFTETSFRRDVFLACEAFDEAYRAGRRPRLFGEDLKLYTDGMRDYRRLGMQLDDATRAQVESLQKQLNQTEIEFDQNISNASVEIGFTAEELAGVPDGFLTTVEVTEGVYTLKPTVITHVLAVMQNARSEETRRRMKTARYSVAMEENEPLLEEMVRLRSEIAALLGYDSWADYRIEIKMARTGAAALAFENDLVSGLEPKFRAEIEEFRRMKAADTGDPNARVELWDWRYYENQLKKQRHNVDGEALRVFFPLERCLAGMFRTYEQIFGVKYERVEAPYVWEDGVELWMTSDSRTGEPLGLFYLDMFPREGKYNHFAQFGIIDGKLMPSGKYQRPVVALVCNFTPPTADRPSLLSHDELETLFHEFGHAMHSILTQARFAAFSGTNVPGDFVEAPSQMLESWVWDVDVLDTFAADYRDPTRKIDRATLERLEAAKLATIGTFYRRQLAFGVADLRLHMGGAYGGVRETVNGALAEVFFTPPAGTNFAAYWGHLSGYDAGYYGYAWADAIAADMADVFENSPDGLMDRRTGMRLRDEIYAVGGSREIDESIKAFLQRERSNDPFLRSLGIR